MLVCKVIGRYTQHKERINATFFLGEKNQTKQNAGTLKLKIGEWQLLMAALDLGAAATHDHLGFECEDPLKIEYTKKT